jgi:O-antigen/teichoic acid export membrane protein
MIGIRRALLFTSVGRYVVLAINFVAMAIVARLLTPAEIGLSVIATAAVATAESLRDFGTISFLIQRREVTRDTVRTAFTVMFLMSALLAGALWAAAGPFARLYGEQNLIPYLHLVAVGFLSGAFSGPLLALLRRDMAFGKLATVEVVSTTVAAVLTVVLALLGFSYMSFAWAAPAWGITAACVALLVRPDYWIFRLQLKDWRDIVSFGGYSAATALLVRAAELLPSLILGRIVGFAAVGLYSRALMLSQLPDRLILTLVRPLTLPAFSAEVRAGNDLKAAYLGAVGHVAAAWWPSLVVLALLAHPAVEIALGHQWFAVVPLVQITAVGYLPYFLVAGLGYSIMVSLGAIRQTTIINLIYLPLCIGIVSIAAFFGIEAVALSTIVTNIILVLICLWFIRSHIAFTWRELWQVTQKSVAVTLCSAAGPAVVIAFNGFRFDISIITGLAAGVVAAVGWLAGLFLIGHPLAGEIRYGSGIVRRAWAGGWRERMGTRPL